MAIKKLRKKTISKKPKKARKIKRRGRPRLAKTTKTVKTGSLKLLRGMQDILPQKQVYWEYLIGRAEKLAKAYGFSKIDTPLLEDSRLFKRSIGSTSDIVMKEMFTFVDRGGYEVALRPEMTASIARAYIEQGMVTLTQPVKLYYFGPMFRHERPQAGRFRQFHQFGLEVIGSPLPVIDAQIILFSHALFQDLGVKVDIQVNSLGCSVCRAEYKRNLLAYLRKKKQSLCSNCQKRLKRNPLRILDCKEDRCQSVAAIAPQIVDYLCDECKNHFIKVLEYLDGLAMPYTLNPRVVRGLDYYTKTIFEVWPSYTKATEGTALTEKIQEKPGSQSALGGGGRYDGLIENLGGTPTPACGLAFGIERIIAEIKKQKVRVSPKERPPQIFLSQLGEVARKKALKLFEDLRVAGVKVAEALAKSSLKTQLEVANKLKVKFTLILGQKEVLDKTIILRDMTTGNQETVDFDKVIAEVKKRL